MCRDVCAWVYSFSCIQHTWGNYVFFLSAFPHGFVFHNATSRILVSLAQGYLSVPALSSSLWPGWDPQRARSSSSGSKEMSWPEVVVFDPHTRRCLTSTADRLFIQWRLKLDGALFQGGGNVVVELASGLPLPIPGATEASGEIGCGLWIFCHPEQKNFCPWMQICVHSNFCNIFLHVCFCAVMHA